MKTGIQIVLVATLCGVARLASSRGVSTEVRPYGLFAESEMRLRDAQVRAGGVGVNQGGLLVTNALDAAGAVVSDRMRLAERTRCAAVVANQIPLAPASCTPPVAFQPPIVASLAEECGFPTEFPACDAGDPSRRVVVSHRGVASLTPGVYGSVSLLGGGPGAGTLELSEGTYVFCDLRLARNAIVRATGPATVYVNGALVIGNGAQLGGPASLDVYFAGRRAQFSRGATLTGDLCAPAALLSIGDDVTIDGCVAADRIRAQDNLVVTCEPGSTTTTTTVTTLPTTSTTSTTMPTTTTTAITAPTTSTTTTLPTTTTTTAQPTTSTTTSTTTTVTTSSSTTMLPTTTTTTSTTRPTTTTTTVTTSSITTTLPTTTSTTTGTTSTTTTTLPTTTTTTTTTLPTTTASTTSTTLSITTTSTTTTTVASTTTTTGPPFCGNGRTEGTEECDDGNEENTDGCTTQCKAARCGDGIVRFGVESCDDGNTNPGDCCNNCAYTTPVCGNGCLTPGETCDDGNAANGDNCPSTCVINQCVPDGTTQVVTVRLQRTSPPALGSLSAVSLFLDYPDGVVSLPGAGQETTVLNRTAFQLSTSGRSLTRFDLDYGMRLGVLGLANMLPNTNVTNIFQITFDHCTGAPAPTAGQFPCTVQGATASSTDYTAAQLAGVACMVTIP